MNAKLKEDIQNYIKSGITSTQMQLDLCQRRVAVYYNKKRVDGQEALKRAELTLQLYLDLQEDFDAGNFKTDRMLMVRKVLEEYEKTSPMKALEPFVKIANSGELSGIMQCFNISPNAFYELDGKQFYATVTPIGENLKTTIAWLGGALKPVGIKLAHFIMANYTGQAVFKFNLQDFMHYAGLTHRDRSAEVVKQEVEKLSTLTWIVEERQARRPGKGWFGFYGLLYKNNVITVTLTIQGHAMMEAARGYCYFPTNLGRRDLRYNPHSITLGAKLSYMKGLNWGKTNCDIYGAMWIIKDTDIPTPEEVEAYQFKNLIITPFERDMDANEDIYSWKYIEGSGDNWKEFQHAVVKIIWKNHPQDLLERPKNATRKRIADK